MLHVLNRLSCQRRTISFTIWRDFSPSKKHAFGGNPRNFIVYNKNDKRVHAQKFPGGGEGTDETLFFLMGTLKFKLLDTTLGEIYVFWTLPFYLLFFLGSAIFSSDPLPLTKFLWTLPNSNKGWLHMIIFLLRTWKWEWKRQRTRERLEQRR